MNLRRTIIFALFHVPYFFHKLTATGAFGRQSAAYLHKPLKGDGNALKAALVKHYEKQFHEASCSVASVVMVVNALKSIQNRPGATFHPISQMDILEKVRTAHWKERMGEGGHNGKRGLPLPVLNEVVKSSLKAYGIRYKTFETVQAQKSGPRVEKIKTRLWQRLEAFEQQGNAVMIAHFDQGAYIPGLNIPHISPVGGFDAKKGLVTILDVDYDVKYPYQISFETFYKGLASNYNFILRPFGFKSGGYVYIGLD
jgi:hypothetical protein